MIRVRCKTPSRKFAKRAQNEFDVKVKKLRSDNGSKFKNTNIEEYLDEEGVAREFSVPYTPQQNGIVERKNRTLIEAARTMLDEYKTLDQFWWRRSTRHAMLSTNFTYTRSCKRQPTSFKPVKSLMCLTLELLEVGVSFSTGSPKALSLHLKLMKVFFLVMLQTLMVTVFSTIPPDALKSCAT
jgi:transposase InsO family protein